MLTTLVYEYLALATTLCILSSGSAASSKYWHRGIVFGGGEWSSPDSPLGSNNSKEAMQALAATGATHVRIICTWYQHSINTTTVYPIEAPSPLASSTIDEVESMITYAHSLGLNITLCPVLDPSWDNPANKRAGPSLTSRLQIGIGFSESDWTLWFKSYSAYVLMFVNVAATHSVALVELAAELDHAFISRPTDWRELVSKARAVYKGPLTVAVNPNIATKMTWWDSLDFIGLDMYESLGENVPLSSSPTVAQLVTPLQMYAQQFHQLSKANGDKPIIITETGFQSRPCCHVHPLATVDRDDNDDSAWLQDHDPVCQANAYEAMMQVFTPQSWFAGIYWWLWRTDPTQGGACDSAFTPHGKRAEKVLRKYFTNNSSSNNNNNNNNHNNNSSNNGSNTNNNNNNNNDTTNNNNPTNTTSTSTNSTNNDNNTTTANVNTAINTVNTVTNPYDDGRESIVNALRTLSASIINTALTSRNTTDTEAVRVSKAHTLYNGFDFGGPDEWSSPDYRFDSEGAQQSLLNMKSVGADSVEVIVQWYFSNVSSTTIYPIVDKSNVLRTSTDEELISILAFAKQNSMKTILTLMLDPDWTLPDQNFCRGHVDSKKCFWRGQLGMFWDSDDCSETGKWGTWFKGYTETLVHYAKLANASDVNAFLLSHELQTATQVCPELWNQATAAVKFVFEGDLTRVSTESFRPCCCIDCCEILQGS